MKKIILTTAAFVMISGAASANCLENFLDTYDANKTNTSVIANAAENFQGCVNKNKTVMANEIKRLNNDLAITKTTLDRTSVELKKAKAESRLFKQTVTNMHGLIKKLKRKIDKLNAKGIKLVGSWLWNRT